VLELVEPGRDLREVVIGVDGVHRASPPAWGGPASPSRRASAWAGTTNWLRRRTVGNVPSLMARQIFEGLTPRIHAASRIVKCAGEPAGIVFIAD
jgi:hypothetical protein